MKMIILAAGQGTRLRPLTNDKPKCMVEYQGKTIIDSVLQAAQECGIENIAVVDGYKKEVLESYLADRHITFYTNEDFGTTNMVSTLFCAESFMDDDIVISYADIVYDKEILEKLMLSTDDFSVVIDKAWQELWKQRMDNPLEDAETLKIEQGNIIELGKKPNDYQDIQGQYIGLIKISKRVLQEIINFYHSLDRSNEYDGKNFDNMYMTSFIQMIIDHLLDVKPVIIHGGWVEIDCVDDLSIVKVI